MIEIKTQDRTTLINKKIQQAQKTGFIQIINAELAIFPNEVANIADIRFDNSKWWEINPITKVDLSNNNIKEVPPEIANLVDLVSFRMQNNKLESLPETLFTIPTLKSVDCSHNQLRRLPPTVVDCYTLVELNLKGNLIDLLPVSYGKLVNLEILDLSGNKLKKFTLHENELPRLKRLDLSENQIEELDANISTLKELELLNLSKNRISKLPEGVFKGLKNIRLLDLKENKLTAFEEFPETGKLDSIFLSYNQLKYIAGFEKCPNLTVLDLKSNKLEKLNPDISLLKELKTLDISNNDLSDIPTEIGFMTKLVRVSLEGNPLKSIRSSVRSAGTEVLKKYLREKTDVSQSKSEVVKEFNKISQIDVWDQFIKDFLVAGKELTVTGKGINQIHDKFCALNLIVLDLSKNNISEINPNLINLTNLQKLRLNDNKIECFPGDILIQFPVLEELELRGNKLKTLLDDIPPEYYFEFFQTLKHVDLSQNQFDHVPAFLAELPRLRVISLGYNKITNVDILFNEKMCSLEILDISNNKIKTLSDNIAYLDKLEHLNIEYNDIAHVPTIIGFMPNIKNLNLYGNPLKNIRNDVISKGPKYVLEYLKTRHQGDYVPPKRTTPQRMYIEEPPKDIKPEEDEYEIKNYKVTQINPQQIQKKSMEKTPNQRIEEEQPYDPLRYKGQHLRENNAFMKPSYEPDPKILKEIQLLDEKVAALENELRENFTLSTNQIMTKKREINQMKSQKNKLLQAMKGDSN